MVLGNVLFCLILYGMMTMLIIVLIPLHRFNRTIQMELIRKQISIGTIIYYLNKKISLYRIYEYCAFFFHRNSIIIISAIQESKISPGRGRVIHLVNLNCIQQRAQSNLYIFSTVEHIRYIVIECVIKCTYILLAKAKSISIGH